jgi:hypothetical protein
LLVAALKKEVLQEYSELLSGCGLTPVFTLAALARGRLCANPPVSYAVLDVGRGHSELISFDHGIPTAIRILPWGGEDLTRAIEKSLAVTHQEAEKLKLDWGKSVPLSEETVEQPSIRTDRIEKISASVEAELKSLARYLQSAWTGQKLYLTGATASLGNFLPQFAKTLGGGTECERLDVLPGEGRSAAIFGLKRACEENGSFPSLVLEVASTHDSEKAARPVPWNWAALAGVLVLSSLALRYAEPLLLKPRVTRKLAELKAYRESLPKIERDLSFLQYLKTNQPPYLEPFFVLANSAPAGARIESLSINRRGDLSLRAGMKDGQQVVDFRSKLINSGLFSTVVVEEQAPTPDRQKIVVRITGQWKQNAIAPEPSKAVAEKAKAPPRTSKVVTNAPVANE